MVMPETQTKEGEPPTCATVTRFLPPIWVGYRGVEKSWASDERLHEPNSGSRKPDVIAGPDRERAKGIKGKVV